MKNRMNIRHWLVGLIVASMAMLAGCASTGSGRHIDDPTSSLVFAYIDMDEAPTDISYANLHQVVPKTDMGYWGMSEEDGLLFNQYLPQGAYQLSNFGGSSFLSGEHRYNFPQYGRNETAVTIEQPGIYFLGAYQYQDVETGFFEAGKFAIEPVSSPSERELLKRLSQLDWVKGTQWEARIRDRLAELRQ